MQSVLTLEVTFEDQDAKWQVAALSKWNDRIELCRSHECGPFTTASQIERWLLGVWTAWVAPQIGTDASESLHEAYDSLAP
jgi:hypothetical protein